MWLSRGTRSLTWGLAKVTFLAGSIPGHQQVCPVTPPLVSPDTQSQLSVRSEASSHEEGRGRERMKDEEEEGHRN